MSVIVAQDSFTGTAGTDVTARAGDLGTLTRQGGSTGAIVITDANRCRGNDHDLGSNHYTDRVTLTADYDVSANFRVFSLVTNHFTAVMGRMDTASDSSYYIGYDSGGTFWQLVGNNVQLASVGQVLVAGNTYNAMLRMRGTTIKGFVDGVEIMSVTDSSVTRIGRGGIGCYQVSVAPTNTTGIHYDDLQISDPFQIGLVTPKMFGQAVKRAACW